MLIEAKLREDLLFFALENCEMNFHGNPQDLMVVSKWACLHLCENVSMVECVNKNRI